ncbi:MAG: glycosyltransferase family 4 protein [Candidatus Jordarchaeaceae archaeon]
MVEGEQENLMWGKKILFVTTISWTLSAFLLPYAEAIRKKGGIIDAMCSGATDEIEEHFRKIWSIEFTRNPLLVLLFLPYLLIRIRNIISREGYDIVHVHTPIASFISRMSMGLIGKSKRPLVVYTAHGFFFHPLGGKAYNWIFKILERMAAKYTDYLITINEWDFNEAKKLKLIEDSRIYYIKGIGVDTRIYNYYAIDESYRDKIRKDLNCLDNEILLCTIGEFIRRKRHRDILYASEYLMDIPVKVVFVGCGKLKNKIRRLINKMRLQDRVILAGYRSDIPDVLSACDTLIFPSIKEGMPRVVMEAMSMKTPVVAYDIRGVRELLSDGCGILVEPRNVKQLADAIRLILENERETVEMTERAFKKILREFDIDVVMPQHLAVYERAIIERAYRIKGLLI